MSTKFVLDSPELEAVILSLRIVGTELRKEIYARSRATIAPEWQGELSNVVGANKLAQRVLVDTARVNVGTRGVTLTAAKGSRKLSGGFVPNVNFAAVEFGATWRDAKVSGRRGNKRYDYQRKINTGFKHRRAKGYYAYPTGDKFVFRYASLWIATVARTLHDAVEGKL
jgi:hypothetical protein